MRLHGIRHMVTRIKTRMAQNRRTAEQCNREFLEFWQTQYGR